MRPDAPVVPHHWAGSTYAPAVGQDVSGSASRDAEIWRALRAARPRPEATDPAAFVGSLAGASERFVSRIRAAGAGHEVRVHEPVRHARHLAATWMRPLGITVRATLFEADGEHVLVAVPADRKIDAPRLRGALGVDRLAVLRADRGVGRLGWTNLPGDPGPLPGLPEPFGARLIVDPEILGAEDVVLSFSPTSSVRVAPSAYVTVAEGVVVGCVGRTRLLPGGGVTDCPPRDP